MIIAIIILAIFLILSIILNVLLFIVVYRLIDGNEEFLQEDVMEYFRKHYDEKYEGTMLLDIALGKGPTSLIWDLSRYAEMGIIGLTMRVGDQPIGQFDSLLHLREMVKQNGEDQPILVIPAIVYRKGTDFFWEFRGGQL